MMWDEWYDFQQHQQEESEESEDSSHVNFDFFSVLSKPKDYYKILEVDYNASDEAIRSNYIRLALKWHPDKKKNEDNATSKFQEINEAYKGSNATTGSRSPLVAVPLMAKVLNLGWMCLFDKRSNGIFCIFTCWDVVPSCECIVPKIAVQKHVLPVLSDPVKRHEYDKNGIFYSYDSNIAEYLNRYKGLILTCNGLGMKCSMW